MGCRAQCRYRNSSLLISDQVTSSQSSLRFSGPCLPDGFRGARTEAAQSARPGGLVGFNRHGVRSLDRGLRGTDFGLFRRGIGPGLCGVPRVRCRGIGPSGLDRRRGLGGLGSLVFLDRLHLVRRREPREDGQVKHFHHVRRLAAGIDERLEGRALFQLALDVARVEQVQPLAGVGLLLRSFSMPVARAERPNSARNGLVMLPSPIATAGMSFGM